jgi:hypothetical protein
MIVKLCPGSNYKVDGTHHAITEFDQHRNRQGVPWGACINSSQE